MITLYTFGPAFGLPDPSPFVTKADMLLKLSGLSYQAKLGSLSKAPKGKLPYILDDGRVIADSTFIRLHLEQAHGVDFDKGYTPAERAAGWAFEKMCEEHLYFALLDARWMVDKNFDNGPRRFFDAAPAPLRPLIIAMVRRSVRKSLQAQGFGRHARADIEALAIRDIEAIAAYLGSKPYFLGDRVSGADATVFAFVMSALCPVFETPIRSAAEAQPNLVSYAQRLKSAYYPDLAKPL